MERREMFKERIPLILTLVVFLAALVLAVIFRSKLQETVLIPILYLVWIGNLAIRSLDQNCIWVAALLLAIAIGLSSTRRAKKPVEALPAAARRTLATGRIHFWRNQIGARRGVTAPQRLRSWEARRLFYQLMAYREHTSVEEIKKRFNQPDSTLPDEIRLLLVSENGEVEPTQALSLFDQIRRALSFVFGFSGRDIRAPDPMWEKVADYFESLVEVDDDIRNC